MGTRGESGVLGGGECLEGANRKNKTGGKIGKKWLEMVWKALGTPRNPFKSGKTNRKHLKSEKNRKNWKEIFSTGNGPKSIGNLTYPNRLGYLT